MAGIDAAGRAGRRVDSYSLVADGLTRRDCLLLLGSAPLVGLGLAGCGSDEPGWDVVIGPWPGVRADASRFGRWQLEGNVPVFVYDADHTALPEWDRFGLPPTRRHWILVGNRAISLEAANDGTVALFDESEGLRWLVAARDASGSAGTGVSVVRDAGLEWGSAFAERPPGSVPERTFAPTSFSVRDAHDGVTLVRTLLCPEGEVPWVLVRVALTLAPDAAPRTLMHEERWRLRPRFMSFFEAETVREGVSDSVNYETTLRAKGIQAAEIFDPDQPKSFGAPALLLLEALGDTPGEPISDGQPQPTLAFRSEVTLEPGETRELWFRFGRAEGESPADPAALFQASLAGLADRLPVADAARAPEAQVEVPWHAGILTGNACRDRVLGGHTLDQRSAYAFIMGFNGAVRDPLQHALPLVYSEPDLALSVLRNVAAWGSPDGDLPYALDGNKQPIIDVFRPSDSSLWSLWLASEYAAATGDLSAFEDLAGYHPSYGAPAVSLADQLAAQFRFFVDQVGRGARGHVRILNADWNDFAIRASGAPPTEMIERGGSVLNSAMAAWVLDVYAGLAERLGQSAIAVEARSAAGELRELVRQAHNGSWFHRAYAPDGTPVGDAECWLEVQPWAILCGAAGEAEARSLLELIRDRHSEGSPVGARVIWPIEARAGSRLGEGIDSGIWFSINMTLVWAAARFLPEYAWSEWRKMTLLSHAAAYPDVWEGTLSGPDAYNSPESVRPGRTWELDAFAMQSYPVNNLHSHSQPLLAYLRLLGVEPDAQGALRVGGGGGFRSRTFGLAEDGSGELVATGAVVIESPRGTVNGKGGIVRF
jgi:hypothetical protein